ncbi:MAG TPA: ABC transporter ATP-binding protein [Streptosporangiaceae bacterium]|nr:ABC transporter ATP-binding protein [Streptosporangiaceae bacterium]
MGRIPDSAVRVRNLRKRYEPIVALDGIDLDIARGEVFALLGPNGAGKTTAVEILEGHRDRDAGEVEVLGEDPAGAGREWRSRIGIVLQTAYDTAELTVAESVRHFARYYPSSRDPDETIATVGLAGRADSRIRHLSPGLRRRLDVALGIIGAPELLFLDEPTTGFDPEARKQFWQLVKQLANEGTTILLTTHYLEEAEYLADRVGVLVNGKVVAAGELSELAAARRATVTVSWRGPDGRQAVQTSAPTKLIVELSERFGGEVPELGIVRPTLEDTYFDLVEGASR